MNLSSRDVRLCLSRHALVALLGVAAIGLPFQAAAIGDPNAEAAMEKYLARPTVAHQYSASRRLEAAGSGQRGWLDVQTHFTLESGFVYEVTAEGGSGYIRSRILRSLLDEEQRLIARGGSAGVAISEDNYEFTPEGVNEEGFAAVRMKPLRKDRSLIAGLMLLTAEDGDLVRVEGRLAKNPSFWLTRVNLVRSYERINGVLMPVSLETSAQLRFLGSSQLRMTYHYSHIDEQPVGPDDTAHAPAAASARWRVLSPEPVRRAVLASPPRSSGRGL